MMTLKDVKKLIGEYEGSLHLAIFEDDAREDGTYYIDLVTDDYTQLVEGLSLKEAETAAKKMTTNLIKHYGSSQVKAYRVEV